MVEKELEKDSSSQNVNILRRYTKDPTLSGLFIIKVINSSYGGIFSFTKYYNYKVQSKRLNDKLLQKIRTIFVFIACRNSFGVVFFLAIF